MSYQIGKVYIWQNQTGGAAILNGQETTVTGAGWGRDQAQPLWETSPRVPPEYQWKTSCAFIFARVGDLRPKEPPSGEQSVMDQFKAPVREVEPV